MTLCSDCHKPADDPVHADKNRQGHFFNLGRPLVSERPEKNRVCEKRSPEKEQSVPSIEDYKFWIRSEAKQWIVIDALTVLGPLLDKDEREIAAEMIDQLQTIMARREANNRASAVNRQIKAGVRAASVKMVPCQRGHKDAPTIIRHYRRTNATGSFVYRYELCATCRRERRAAQR